jgi:hypothetical protein
MTTLKTKKKGSRRPALTVALFALLAVGGFAQAGSQDEAAKFFAQGLFDEAALSYSRAAAADPRAYEPALGLGRISLLRNDLAEAEKWLSKAMALQPQEKEPKALLGEVLYRRYDYAQAAPLLEAAGQQARAEKLRAFQDKTPFLIESGPETCALDFVQTDPLPIIKVTVNGREGKFLIDTGGWELHVFAEFAAACGLKALGGMQTGTYAGGRQAAAAFSVADRVQLGEFALRHVPVVLPASAGRRPFQVDGIVGTVVLYRFLFTLDYPRGRLVLRRNTPEASRAVRAEAGKAGAVRVPFWLAGDHFIFARGTVNDAGPYLFLVDSGMGGGGFDCPESVVREAKIELSKEGFQGMGGGGPVTVYPFTVNVSLGEARRDGVRGLFGALPPGSENRLGFRSGGLVSHGFFRPFAITFDFQAMVMYLEKAAAAEVK